jgi:hypothetical protein
MLDQAKQIEQLGEIAIRAHFNIFLVRLDSIIMWYIKAQNWYEDDPHRNYRLYFYEDNPAFLNTFIALGISIHNDMILAAGSTSNAEVDIYVARSLRDVWTGLIPEPTEIPSFGLTSLFTIFSLRQIYPVKELRTRWRMMSFMGMLCVYIIRTTGKIYQILDPSFDLQNQFLHLYPHLLYTWDMYSIPRRWYLITSRLFHEFEIAKEDNTYPLYEAFIPNNPSVNYIQMLLDKKLIRLKKWETHLERYAPEKSNRYLFWNIFAPISEFAGISYNIPEGVEPPPTAENPITE